MKKAKKPQKKKGRGIQETLDFIVDHMATKDDVREIIRQEVPGIVALEVKDIRETVKHIEKRLEKLAEQYENLKGVTKEIDDLRTQLRVIQKHLGLKQPASADA